MRRPRCAVAVAFAFASVFMTLAAEARTFDDVLGREDLEGVVTAVVAARIAAYQATAAERVQVDLSAKFVPAVVERVRTVETELSRGAARERLRERFGLAMTRFVQWLETRRALAEKTVLEVYEAHFEEYLATEHHCGEIPCGIPPCCKNCDPPKECAATPTPAS